MLRDIAILERRTSFRRIPPGLRKRAVRNQKGHETALEGTDFGFEPIFVEHFCSEIPFLTIPKPGAAQKGSKFRNSVRGCLGQSVLRNFYFLAGFLENCPA